MFYVTADKIRIRFKLEICDEKIKTVTSGN